MGLTGLQWKRWQGSVPFGGLKGEIVSLALMVSGDHGIPWHPVLILHLQIIRDPDTLASLYD